VRWDCNGTKTVAVNRPHHTTTTETTEAGALPYLSLSPSLLPLFASELHGVQVAFAWLLRYRCCSRLLACLLVSMFVRLKCNLRPYTQRNARTCTGAFTVAFFISKKTPVYGIVMSRCMMLCCAVIKHRYNHITPSFQNPHSVPSLSPLPQPLPPLSHKPMPSQINPKCRRCPTTSHPAYLRARLPQVQLHRHRAV
jgi:hypothetical protein